MIGLMLMLVGVFAPEPPQGWSLRVEVFRCAIIIAGAVIMVVETTKYLRFLLG